MSNGRAPDETGREAQLRPTEERYTKRERLLRKLSDVRNASESPPLRSAMSGERVLDENGLLSKLSDVRRKSARPNARERLL